MADGVITPSAQTNPEVDGEQKAPVVPDPENKGPVEGGEQKTELKVDEKPPEGLVDDKVPDSYDLKMPEGSLLQTADLDKLKAEAKEMGLSNEEAQEYLESQDRAVKGYHDAQEKHVAEIKKQWIEDAKADKIVGGEKFKENMEVANRAFKNFVDQNDPTEVSFCTTLLEDYGFGNNPMFLRIFTRIGRAMAEDKLVHAQSQSGGGPKDAASVMYPTMQTKN